MENELGRNKMVSRQRLSGLGGGYNDEKKKIDLSATGQDSGGWFKVSDEGEKKQNKKKLPSFSSKELGR